MVNVSAFDLTRRCRLLIIKNIASHRENIMKQFTFKFVMLALAIVAMVGCSKEQSSFDMEDLTGRAEIVGKLTYNAGTHKGYSTNTLDASNVRVVARVLNSSIKSGTSGYSTYEATTNYNGEYSIKIPTTYNTSGVTVELSAVSFFGTYYVNGVAEENQVLYELSGTTLYNVKPNDVKAYNGCFTKKN